MVYYSTVSVGTRRPRTGGGLLTARRRFLTSTTENSHRRCHHRPRHLHRHRHEAFLQGQQRLFFCPSSSTSSSSSLSSLLMQETGRHENHIHRRQPQKRNFMSSSSPSFSSLRRTRTGTTPPPTFATPSIITFLFESRRDFSSDHLTMNEQWKKMMAVGGRGGANNNNKSFSSPLSTSPRRMAATNNNTNDTSRTTSATTGSVKARSASASAAAFMSLHQNVLYVDTTQNDDDGDENENDALEDDFSNNINGLSSQSTIGQNDKLSSLESDVETLTRAYLSQLMPPRNGGDRSIIKSRPTPFSLEDEMNFDKNNADKHDLTSLDHELGLGSIWDDSEGPDGEKEDGIPEEHFSDDRDIDCILDHSKIKSQQQQHQQNQHRPFPFKTPMEMLRSFDSENPPTSDDPLELQLWMECWSQREAVLKHQQLVDKARDRKAFDAMSLMQRHVIKWFEDLRQAIDARQKEYLARTDKRRAHKRYGPFLCSLHPEKMAVIASQEAIVQCLSNSGKSGLDGVPLVKIATAIGSAVEMEVVSQRRMKERFHKSIISLSSSTDAESEENIDMIDSIDEDGRSLSDLSSEDMKVDLLDKWKFSASHLKLFMDDLERTGMGRNRRGIQYAMRKAKQAMNSGEAWTPDDIVHVGAALLSILVDHTKVQENGRDEPAFRVEKKWLPGNKSKSQSFIIMHDRLRKAFLEDEYLSWAANTTRHTPMIVPPTDWSGPNEGGYKWLITDLMRTHGSSVQREALQHADLSVVCDGLNILGKTAWTINTKILRVGEYCWNNNIPIGDIPSRADLEVPPEPERPSYIDPEVFANRESPEAKAAVQAFQAYNESVYKRKRVLQKNMDLRSLRCSATLKLNQAKRFEDFERIYFPYNLDFRGRAYPIPPHLSNVGSDLCRGVLKFADAKPLGKRGMYWLKVHLANFAGMDKVSFDDRAKFIEDNIDKVRQSVDVPFSDDPWWMTLDDPFQGLATCHEIINAIDSGDPESYMCSLPVHMDGSCNGLQHYAALGRDEVGGKAVNLLESDGPEDVYVGVMHEVIRRVADEAASDVPFDTSDPSSLTRSQQIALKHNKAAKLVNGLIDRGVVKRTVMTSVYGVTYIGARQQIQEKIEEKLEEKGYDLDDIDREIFAASGYLATITMEVMGDLFQGAKKTKQWLADCARIISQQGHPVAWISPIGVPAVQPYRQRRPRTVVTVMQSVTIIDDNDDLQVHKSRQCTAFPPNYVHSLDSSHMLMTAMEMDRRGLTFSAVHDSFWTHACDVDEMNEALRDCFIDLYSKPLLGDLKESWELRYPGVEFPTLPETGDLDLNEVKSAKYFFQ
mmetsp:Transcript_29541/g.71354  ORF Transcript_29541/g.71354 Transcript_29541/m.71354 type:complete len:1318 (-) Transcript_29541:310-4263(-)